MTKSGQSQATLLHTIGGYSFHVIRLALAICLLIMLFTYDITDGGFFTTIIDANQINNSIGIIGAYFADLLIHLFGVTAFLLPILLILGCSQAFFNIPPVRKTTLIVRYSAIIGFLLSLSILFSLHISLTATTYPEGAGGMIGNGLGSSLVKAFGLWGSNIILLLMMFLTMSYQLSLDWDRILIRTGMFFERHAKTMWAYATKSEHDIENATMHRPAYDNIKLKSVFKKSRNPIKVVWQKIVKQKPSESQASISDTPQTDYHSDIPVHEAINNSDVLDALGTPKHQKQSHIQTPPQVQDRVRAETMRQEPSFTEFRTPNLDMTKAVNTPSGSAASQPEAIDKRDVKIVPLEQTHKQDTGDSSVTTEHKRKKSKSCPPVSLLDAPSVSMNPGLSKEEIQQMSDLLELKLLDFGVVAEVVEVNPGPVITRFEIQPAPGTKVSKISNLAKDLARSMAVLSVRVVEVIAGKSVIGLEIPNQHREMVCISEVLGSKTYETSDSPLTMGLGNDIAGKPVVVDLAKMPHLLVAGTTGSGKSVGVNAMIISLLLKSTPDQIRLLLVDPKMLELSIYDGIPHLLAPVITDMKEAAGGLRWCVAEMERRYKVMASQGVRNIAGYNQKVIDANSSGMPIPDPTWQPDDLLGETLIDRPNLEEFPYIVVVVDEFADMMMIVGKKVEELIARIAQKARAAGIHLILATQRPSVDVITGLIKANVPTRIAFQVSSKIDSRTILDQGGAESLLGHGDMLYLPAGKSVPERVHGAFVSDDEVHRVVHDWKQRGSPEFVDAIIKGTYEQDASSNNGNGGEGSYEEEQDSLYDEAVAFVTQTRRASISSVQRQFRIGYNRAARMIEAMEAAGVITSQSHNGSREVIAPPPIKD